jgi:hypothetical protein
MTTIAAVLCAGVLLVLSLLVVYQWALAIFALGARRRRRSPLTGRERNFTFSSPRTTKRRVWRPRCAA